MPRERLWHVAETSGHGCCFSVGIQDAEGNMVADVVYREDGPLIAAAPDHALLVVALIRRVARWEPFLSYIDRGELCVGGLRYTTALDEFGCPMLTAAARDALKKATGDAP